MSILERIHSPADLKALPAEEIPALCAELRSFLVENLAKTGGHLASNLGAVELTVAIDRVYSTEKDRLVFDVGHQSYVHKILTGRREAFSTLRQFGGCLLYTSSLRSRPTSRTRSEPSSKTHPRSDRSGDAAILNGELPTSTKRLDGACHDSYNLKQEAEIIYGIQSLYLPAPMMK